MPDRALQLPYAEDEAAKVGRKVFRKQILPVGSIEYEGRTLDFSREYLQGLADNFNAGVFDQVPFQFADGENKHTFDPERTRGEVKAVELADDGLYGIVETTDEGAKVIEDNPKLGVSARIVEGIERGGNALQHVLATLDPRVTGMKPWEAVNLAVPDDAQVVDLTALEFAGASNPQPRSSSPTVSETATKSPEELLADYLAGNGEEGKEPVVASLSEDDRKAIELATRNANDANERARKAEEALDTERFERLRDSLVAEGVPPADIKLAEPVLKGGSGTIELSNGEKADAHTIVTKLLESRKGTINLTTLGAGGGEEGSEQAQAKELAEAWEKQSSGVSE